LLNVFGCEANGWRQIFAGAVNDPRRRVDGHRCVRRDFWKSPRYGGKVMIIGEGLTLARRRRVALVVVGQRAFRWHSCTYDVTASYLREFQIGNAVLRSALLPHSRAAPLHYLG
jgi:hypothetical protein